MAGLVTVPTQIAAILNDLQLAIGVTTYTLNAIDPPPVKWDTAQLPGCYILSGAAQDDDTPGSDNIEEGRTYLIQVPVLTVGEGDANARETRCRPWIQLLKNYLRQRPGLGDATHGNLQGIVGAKVMGDSGIVVLSEYDSQFVGFEIQLKVIETFERTYAPYQ